MRDLVQQFVKSFQKAVRAEMTAMQDQMGPFEVPVETLAEQETPSGSPYTLYDISLAIPSDKLVLHGECTLTYVGGEQLATITAINRDRLTLRCDRALPAGSSGWKLVIYPWFLYEKLLLALEALPTSGDFQATSALTLFGKVAPRLQHTPAAATCPGLNASQQRAIQLCCDSNVSFVWGPPGSGKTKTLSHIVIELLQQGHRVLLTSTTNAAIDQALAILAVHPAAQSYMKNGHIVRVGQTNAETFGTPRTLGTHRRRRRVNIPGPIRMKTTTAEQQPGTRIVTLREILQGHPWSTNTMTLPLALGRDAGGRDRIFDLVRAPHLLVAGATGSGKSVCLRAMLSGLLMSRKPDELQFILIDPTRVEFPTYHDLPHLLVPVVTDTQLALSQLRWAITEMERRYKLLQGAKARNIHDYNTRDALQIADECAHGNSSLPAKLPYIVIVIGEIADLFITGGQALQDLLIHLTLLSSKIGIHVILSTQRPSKHVLTQEIKANFPCCIAFQVAQQSDSHTMIDQSGAEMLTGRGDMLFRNPQGQTTRMQGALVNNDDLTRITNFIRKSGTAVDLTLLAQMIQDHV